jgi:hypothetical protein
MADVRRRALVLPNVLKQEDWIPAFGLVEKVHAWCKK